MFNIGYFKAEPTQWVRHHAGGRIKREGTGLAFYFLRHNAQIVAVPLSSQDVPFVFNETTSNFQAVTLQGQFAFAVREPGRVASLLNFSINGKTHRYHSDDPNVLPQRLTTIVQSETRVEIHARTLEDVLVQTEAIALAVRARLATDARLLELGVELLSLFFVSARPTPEVGRALEATYRETLLRRADEATYARRAAAVEEERKIKENELATDIALEEQRQQFIALEGQNALQEAENRGQAAEVEAQHTARAVEMQLNAYSALEPRMLTAMAFQEMGKNANRIGTLTITPEIVAALMGDDGGPQPRRNRAN